MKNSWLIWAFVIGVIITVFVAFNYQSGQKAVSLSDIFPDEKTVPIDVEYEFVDQPSTTASVATPTPQPIAVSQPAKQQVASMTTQVTAKTTPTPTIATPSGETAATDAKYTIQIGSFKEKDMADKLANTLKEKNFDSFVNSRVLGEKGTWYRVNVGKFQNKSQAEQALGDIQKLYKNSFIISPK